MYFGRGRNGALVGIKEAERGLACDCRCLHCDDPLIAKQGSLVTWHFAHARAERPCAESALHQAAKELLREINELKLPALDRTLEARDVLGRDQYAEARLIGATFPFTTVELEYFVAGRRLDALLTGTDRQLGIEIHVTHAVDEFKSRDLSTCEVSVIEIDISALIGKPIDREELKAALSASAPRQVVSGEDALFASELFQAQLELDERLVQIAQGVRAARTLEPHDVERRAAFASVAGVASDPWPQELDWTEWLGWSERIPRRRFCGWHHSVWQAACLARLKAHSDCEPVSLRGLVSEVTASLGCAFNSAEEAGQAEQALRGYLHGPARLKRWVIHRNDDVFDVPVDIMQDEKVKEFAPLIPEQKAARVDRWLQSAGLSAPPVYSPKSDSFTRALKVPPSVWQSHTWLVWIHRRTGKRIFVDHFREWVLARYPQPGRRIQGVDDMLEGYLAWLCHSRVLGIVKERGWEPRRVEEYWVNQESVPKQTQNHFGPFLCNRCRGPVIRRIKKQGGNAGAAFWGCARFPACAGTAGSALPRQS